MDIDLTLQAFKKHKLANKILICRDGEEAIKFIEKHNSPADPKFPLLVLLDLRLPKFSGLDVLKFAREQPNWKQVTFIVLTTSQENKDIDKAYELGVDSYIVKPVDFDSFLEVVQTIKVYWILINEPPFSLR
ncbi:response regulator [bacterium]|nr:response regulator [bacterium]